jgi:hypothetical protein
LEQELPAAVRDFVERAGGENSPEPTLSYGGILGGNSGG